MRLLGCDPIAMMNRVHIAGIYALVVKDVVFRGFLWVVTMWSPTVLAESA